MEPVMPSARGASAGLLAVLVLAISTHAGRGTHIDSPVSSGASSDESEAYSVAAHRYAAAEARTVPPAPVTDTDVPLPRPVAPAAQTGKEPGLRLGPLIDMAPPAALADPPGPGAVLVGTVEGQIHSVDLDSGENQVVLDLRDRISVGGEQGLLGVAIDPDAMRLYVNYTDQDGDTEIWSWALGAIGSPIDDGTAALHLQIGQPFETHNGGNLVFGPDGALWIATGDGGGFGDPGDTAQDNDSLLGKMLRVVPRTDGGVTAPRSNTGWGRPEIWGIGLRNPWRWSFDRETHRMWIADVGQNAREEISVVDADDEQVNFGWDLVEGDRSFEGRPAHDLVAPVITYGRDDGCAVTGGYVYRGDDNPGLYGWYVFSDFCGRWLRAVPADDPAAEPVELISRISSVVSFGELQDGELVALTAAGMHRLLPPMADHVR
jgi:glucose/arabinose dehydrogenase